MTDSYRNIALMRIPDGFHWPTDFADQAAEHPAREPGPMEIETAGFTGPLGLAHERMTLEIDGFEQFASKRATRSLPSSVVNDEISKRVKEIAQREGRRVGGKERKRVRDAVIEDLLPRAFVTAKRMMAHVDRLDGWLVVGAATAKGAEEMASLVRTAIGRFPVVHPMPSVAPRLVMTEWLQTGKLPPGWALGDEVELRAPVTGGAVWRGSGQDLESDEVKAHLEVGMQVTRLGVEFRGQLGFVLDENLTLRKFKFFDVVEEQDEESAEALALSQFTLVAKAAQQVARELVSIFGLDRPTFTPEVAADASPSMDAGSPIHAVPAGEPSLAGVD